VDVAYFARRRLSLIRGLYGDAVQPFHARKRRIEAGEPPFDELQHYDPESGEPPYLEEWQEADEAILALGSCCLTMLAGTLKLYLTEHRTLSGRPLTDTDRTAFKRNWFAGFKSFFARERGTRFDECPHCRASKLAQHRSQGKQQLGGQRVIRRSRVASELLVPAYFSVRVTESAYVGPRAPLQVPETQLARCRT
jgi:hypothetical protein